MAEQNFPSCAIAFSMPCAGYKGHPFKKSLSDNAALPFKHQFCEQMF
jgi:hypothetical protein